MIDATATNIMTPESISGYRLNSLLHESRRTQVLRGQDADGEPVIIKLLKTDIAGDEERARFRREYAILSRLDIPGVIKPLGFKEHDSGLVMVLEDIGGEDLDCLTEHAKLTMTQFLTLASGLADTLAGLHRQRIMHKDINPAHIIFNPQTGAFLLTGFGMADETPERSVSPQSPSLLEGTLAYISPEQTGRMNRPVDYRTDFYSLGATFYRMLTGRLPFEADDALGMVHGHIARTPIPPHEIDPDIPETVSRIVTKLMAKMAEDRYQSGWGLKADLETCLSWMRTEGVIKPFELAREDFSDRLSIPRKLYGREKEQELLLEAFGRAAAGGCELLLVAGYSGVGKTALIHEIYRPVSEKQGYFIEGKSDQMQQNVPYAVWIQAFAVLVNHLLMEGDVRLTQWKDTILTAVGDLGRVLTDVIPNLELIIGLQPEIPALGETETLSRFKYLFLEFVKAIATADHPLVVFLDDLQWIDAASLNLLQILVTGTDIANILIIGAYRDNEVDASHPLTRSIEVLRQEQARVDLVTLETIPEEILNELLADTLHHQRSETATLARLIYSKTGGNPFFLLQILRALAEKCAISFDVRSRSWTWDIAALNAMEITGNVAELMLGAILQLPEETQRILTQAACIGFRFDMRNLCAVAEQPEGAVREWLLPAERESLIVPVDGEYIFVHDRIQQAAYALIPAGECSAWHLRTGRLLLANTPKDALADTIFKIVHHLNLGARLISSQEEREKLAGLNLIAGRRAKASMAYVSALTWLTAGTALLADDCWERRHELAYSLEISRAECEFLTGDHESAEQRLTVIGERAADTVEHAAVACLRMDLYTTLGKSSRAIAAGLDFLRRLGIDCRPQPPEEEVRSEYERIVATLGNHTTEELVDLPLMSDPASLATVEVLTRIWPPALFTDANLASLIICKAVSLSLERGNCDASCFAYALLGRIAGPGFGDYQAGFRFGQLGCELVERRGLKRFEARTSLCFANSVMPWVEHVRVCHDLQRRALEAANRAGDLLYEAFACNSLNTDLLFAGTPLPQAQGEAELGLAFAGKARFGLVADSIAAQLALIRTLRGLTPEFGCFDDGEYNELRTETHFSNNPALAIAACRYWIRKLQARYLAGDYAAAADAAAKAQQLLWTKPLAFEEADYHFYGAMTRAACCDRAPDEQRRQHLEALAAHHGQLEIWSENCPANFENRAAMVGAEIARIENRLLDAERLFEKAIASARENGFKQNEAVACEAAAAFYRQRGFEKFARTYLTEAAACYAQWGALGKVRQMERQHPWLAETGQPFAATLAEHLDVVSLAKAQQAISSEMEMDKLLGQTIQIAIENAGAQRGFLLFDHDGVWQIAAMGGVDAAGVTTTAPAGMDAGDPVAGGVVRFVARTKECIVLDDASGAGDFVNEPHIRREKTKSLLCAPLLHRGRVIGILYLENNMTTQAFTPRRVQILEMLASQAAISLENARIYEELRLNELRYRLGQTTAHIGTWEYDLRSERFWGSDEAKRIYGFPLERPDFPEDEVEACIPERQRVHQAMLDLINKSAPYDIEFEIRPVNGSEARMISSIAELFRDDQGTPLKVVGVIQDITGRKRAEETLHLQTVELEEEVAERQMAQEKLKKLNEELEQRVKGRTAELEEKNAELHRMNRLFVGRELRMVELKERIRELEEGKN